MEEAADCQWPSA